MLVHWDGIGSTWDTDFYSPCDHFSSPKLIEAMARRIRGRRDKAASKQLDVGGFRFMGINIFPQAKGDGVPGIGLQRTFLNATASFSFALHYP